MNSAGGSLPIECHKEHPEALINVRRIATLLAVDFRWLFIDAAPVRPGTE